MALTSSGDLIVRLGDPAQDLTASPSKSAERLGLEMEPLFRWPGAEALFRSAESEGLEQRWQLAKDPNAKAFSNPWDQAHAAAEVGDYADYFEPDILHDPLGPRAPQTVTSQAEENAAPLGKAAGPLVAEEDFGPHWPPKPPTAQGPGWHLEDGFTGFRTAHARATGTGVRIAHLDTGYRQHPSTPRRMREDLAWDWWDDRAGALDPGTQGLGLFPGHGTSTLALLAGGEVDLTLATKRGTFSYRGDIGGAPDAEILPIRICPSVVHLYTKSLARGLNYALDHNSDVVSLSHGGLPSRAWAAVVNKLYEAGVIVVAASGDSFYYKVVTLATHYTVYPSAFNRVITALGTTYDGGPYTTKDLGQMQGCWGPDSVMWKAICGYTPNVAWMNMRTGGFGMRGGGTSASTPQIAAACALWLQLHGSRYPKAWQRVEACRLALWKSAALNGKNRPQMGWGVLDVRALLDQRLADAVHAQMQRGAIDMSVKDSVSFPVLRILLGKGPPGSERERMYETEVAQISMATANAALLQLAQDSLVTDLDADRLNAFRALLLEEDLSQALRTAILDAAYPPARPPG